MSRVRVRARTKKGAFILASDGQHGNWEVSGRMLRSWSWASMVTKHRFKGKSGFVRGVETLLDGTTK